MVGFYSHETMKYCCYMAVDGILCIQLVIVFIACRMLSHFMYFVRNDEIKMFNKKSINKRWLIGNYRVDIMDAKPTEMDLFHIFKSDQIKANQFYCHTHNILGLKSLPRITHQPKAVLHEVLLHITTITC